MQKNLHSVQNKPMFGNFKLPATTVLVGIAWFAFLTTLTSILVTQDFPSHYHNSDILYIPTLYRDLTEWGGEFFDWKLTPAPYFFPDMLLFFIVMWLIKNYHLTLVISGITQTILYVIGWFCISHFVFSNPKIRNTAYISILLTASINLLLGNSGFIPVNVWQLTISTHFGIILLVPYILALLLACFRSQSLISPSAAGNFILSALITASDFLFICQFTIPAFISIGFLFSIKKITPKQFFISQLPLIGGTIAGILINKLVIQYPSINSYVSFSLDRALESATKFSTWISDLFVHNLVLSALIVFALIFYLVSIFFSLLKPTCVEGDQATLFISLFVLVSIVTTVLIVIGLGDSTSRYLLPLFMLPLYPLPLWIKASFLKKRTYKVIISLFVCLLIGLQSSTFLRLNLLAKYTHFYPPVVECLDQQLSQRNLKYGISSYWDAKYVSMLSKEGVKLLQVSTGFDPRFWISNTTWYSNFFPDFFVFDPNIFPAEIKSLLVERFGNPSEQFECPGRTIFIYNQSSRFRSYIINHPLFVDFTQVGTIAVFNPAFLPGRTGRSVNGNSWVANPDDKPLHLLTYGPRIELPTGQYEAKIFYNAEPINLTDVVGVWDISDSSEQIAKGRFVPNQTMIKTEFLVKGTDRILIRTRFQGGGKLTINRIVLKRVG